MWLTPVVNPHSFGDEGSKSPEGQAFVVEMYAAWRDWVENGSEGANGSIRTNGTPSAMVVVSIVAFLISRLW